MSSALNYLAVLAMIAVAIVLLRGFLNLARGGSSNRSNRLMQWRVILQFVAIVLIVLAIYFARGN